MFLVSNSSDTVHANNNNLQDEFRSKTPSWRSQNISNKQFDNIPSINTSSKFFVDNDDTEEEEHEEDEEEEEEEDCYSTTWSFSSFEEEEVEEISNRNEQGLQFVNKMDDHNNPIYTTATATVKKPISLLTQMLNGSTPPPPPATAIATLQTEKKPLLKRCQSKYQSLSSWFATSTN